MGLAPWALFVGGAAPPPTLKGGEIYNGGVIFLAPTPRTVGPPVAEGLPALRTPIRDRGSTRRAREKVRVQDPLARGAQRFVRAFHFHDPKQLFDAVAPSRIVDSPA
jgi:hypothetical protein